MPSSQRNEETKRAASFETKKRGVFSSVFSLQFFLREEKDFSIEIVFLQILGIQKSKSSLRHQILFRVISNFPSARARPFHPRDLPERNPNQDARQKKNSGIRIEFKISHFLHNLFQTIRCPGIIDSIGKQILRSAFCFSPTKLQ